VTPRKDATADRNEAPDETFVDRVRSLHESLSDRLATASDVDRETADRAVGRQLVTIVAEEMADGKPMAEVDPFDGKDGPSDATVSLDPIQGRIDEFEAELADRDPSEFEGDVLGRIYEGVIPSGRRREMGEYYTPTAVCDLVSRLTVTDADDAVLDPACGSGSFLLGAQRRLRDSAGDSTDGDGPVADRLVGIEPNRTPARLARISLAGRTDAVDPGDVDVRVNDFFDVSPDDVRPPGQDGFDAIVGNPPYVRQEDIDDKDHVRDHLGGGGVTGASLSRRSDLYAYFVTHATQFLRDGGDLGFVTSDRWLDTRYGEDLQRFLLDHYAIRAVITFDRQVFDDALVDSSVLLLRRETDGEPRTGNVATFLRVKAPMAVDDVAALVTADHDPNRLHSTDDYRLVTRRQGALRGESKWNVFFTAPPIYFEIAASPNVVNLSDVADVSYGVKTGANPFFVGRTGEMAELGLDQYVTPLLKASGQVDAIRVTDDVADEWRILDVHDLIERALAETAEGSVDGSAEARVKRWLAENGHDALLEYVRSGEQEGYHERSSLASRDVWFDLGELPRPRILSTMFTWRVHRAFWNAPGAATSDQFYYVDPKGGVDEEVLAGILNSRVVWLANELLGRRAGGEGMTRLQTKVYETERWPVPDPRDMKEERREEIRAAFRGLQEREREVEPAGVGATASERDALDRAVIPALDLERADETVLEALREGVRAMVEMREAGAGERTSVLVDRERQDSEDGDVVELPDGRRTDGTVEGQSNGNADQG
jgi:methylase of polypeptide subunit release factors